RSPERAGRDADHGQTGVHDYDRPPAVADHGHAAAPAPHHAAEPGGAPDAHAGKGDHAGAREDTLDWYAEDRTGTVWYLGEDTKEYENGKISSTEGSWVAAEHGARPGIIMPAHPQPGDRYRQEYYRGHAEDQAEVLSTTERAQ